VEPLQWCYTSVSMTREIDRATDKDAAQMRVAPYFMLKFRSKVNFVDFYLDGLWKAGLATIVART
jgi:hypothetical protein